MTPSTTSCTTSACSTAVSAPDATSMVATHMNLRPSLETIVPGNTIDQRAALNRDTEEAPLCTTILASTACGGSEDTLCLTPPTTPRTTSASSTAASAPDATSMVATPMNLRPSLE